MASGIAVKFLFESSQKDRHGDSVLDSHLRYGRSIARREIDILRLFLEKSIKFRESILICMTGSHARLECRSFSEFPMHLMIICDAKKKGQVEGKIDSLVRMRLIPRGVCVEWKTSPKESLSFCNLTDTIIPSRFLQSLVVIGTQKQHQALISKFVDEIQKMSGKERQKFRKKFFLNHRRQLRAVIAGKDKRGIDLANGVIFYDGRRSQATKYSLLDSIKHFLDLRIIDTIRERTHWPKEYASFVKGMPRSVPELIEYLYSERVLSNLSRQDVDDLKNAYSLGLLYFQTAQNLFFVNKRPVAFSVSNKGELQKACEDAFRIITKSR